MNRTAHGLAALLLLARLQALLAADAPDLDPATRVIPRPLKVQKGPGACTLGDRTVIVTAPPSPELQAVGRYLADLLAPATGFRLSVVSPGPPRPGDILLRTDPSRKDLGDEGYTLTCTEGGVTVTAAAPAGVFHGVQTLRQLLPEQVESRTRVEGVAWAVPGVTIEDRPRFRWRGYLLDPARHFRTTSELKRTIDLLALHKLNVLQLHLTDDQGWRVPIGKYPQLVEVGARLPNHGGQKGEGWFYSRDDVRELVRYAAARYVMLVPEIEMPGHSGAALAAYPELGCGGNRPGGWSGPLCVSRPATVDYARSVLDEVAALFPSPYLHIGGDEVPPGPWRGCPSCRPAMDGLARVRLPADVVPFRVTLTRPAGLPFHEDVGRLHGEFIRALDRHIASRGRRLVGWDEILDGGLKGDSTAVVMAWRSASAVAGAVQQRRDVVVSLYPEYYLDNDTPLRRTYEFEPVPAGLPAGAETHVLGVQANMWGERTPTLREIDRQTFPRLCALAETGWSARDGRDFADFSRRLTPLRRRLALLGVAMNPASVP